MLQRVMIARTLAYEPHTYLMDEPFGSLDAQLRLRMHGELLKLWQQTGATFVFVTHDLQEAITLADRVVVMSQAARACPKLVVDIELPRPRDVIDVQADPAFGAYVKQLWHALDVSLKAATIVRCSIRPRDPPAIVAARRRIPSTSCCRSA